MASKSFRKQPNEIFPIYGSILLNQGSGETVDLAESTITVVDKDGTDVTATILDITSKQIFTDPDGNYPNNAVAVVVRAGTAAASPYKITFLLVTSTGNTWEVDVKMAVYDE